jgi:hypothetical protein
LLLGDHGPYFELSLAQVEIDSFAAGEAEKEHYTEKFSEEGAKLYVQKKTVADRPNPPKEGRW